MIGPPAAEIVRQLIQSTRVASLGTLVVPESAEDNGMPFVSLVTVAAVGPSQLAMLLSGLAKHTQNLAANPACSLLLTEPATDPNASDPIAGARVTLTGSVQKLAVEEDRDVRTAFLASHPSAQMYAGFGDFAFHVFDIEQAHLVAGFGRIQTLTPSQWS